MIEITDVNFSKNPAQTNESIVITVTIKETVDFPYDYPQDYPIKQVGNGE